MCETEKYLFLRTQQNSFEPFKIKACIGLRISRSLQSKTPGSSLSLFPYFLEISLNGKHPPHPTANAKTMLRNQSHLTLRQLCCIEWCFAEISAKDFNYQEICYLDRVRSFLTMCRKCLIKCGPLLLSQKNWHWSVTYFPEIDTSGLKFLYNILFSLRSSSLRKAITCWYWT